MRLNSVIVALAVGTALAVDAVGQDAGGNANPMANFARMLPGEWKVTSNSGTSMFHTWHWGPGRHSIRRMTEGAGADGNPWRELNVYFRDPGRQQIRGLGVSPFARGVSEGTIEFTGETADGVFDLYQSGGRRRKMGLRWAFDGPDRYRDTLLESIDASGLMPLVEFDHVRVTPSTANRTPSDKGAQAPLPSKHLKWFESLLGHTWEARGDWTTGDAMHTRSTFEWIPYADVIYVRVIEPNKDGEPTHLLDAYIYHHTGTRSLRCLALSSRGGVYEGRLGVLDDGALKLDLEGPTGERVGRGTVRFEPERNGTLRHRIWSSVESGNTLLLDIRHAKLETNGD